ncbi:hypothetical protein BKA80DRAFT_275838 [Phyllosticta citrichinensis]
MEVAFDTPVFSLVAWHGACVVGWVLIHFGYLLSRFCRCSWIGLVLWWISIGSGWARCHAERGMKDKSSEQDGFCASADDSTAPGWYVCCSFWDSVLR